MDVHFYATLRSIVGQKTIRVDMPNGSTARQLIDLVVTNYPDLGPELLDENGDFRSHMKMFINGREAVYLYEKFGYIMKPTDKVDIFPPVGGG
ncbi:MAG: ubiquitin-like small modifier protein 1 [Anaerolineales bacterium]